MNVVRGFVAAMGLALISQGQAPSGPIIVSAVREGTDLVIPLIDSINWDTLLPARLQRAAISRNQSLRHELYERRSDYGTEVPFPVTATPAILARSYFLLDSNGVRAVRPTTLRGVAWLEWKSDSEIIEGFRTYGGLLLDSKAEGGFVLIAPKPLTLKLEPSTLSADSLISPNQRDYPNKGTSFWAMLRQYQVHMTAPSEDRWVFVQWAPDSAMVEGGCQLRFSLFRLQPAPVMVSSSDAACDP